MKGGETSRTTSLVRFPVAEADDDRVRSGPLLVVIGRRMNENEREYGVGRYYYETRETESIL